MIKETKDALLQPRCTNITFSCSDSVFFVQLLEFIQSDS